LQYVAVCCGVLQCVAERERNRERETGKEAGSVLQYVAVCCGVLQCVAERERNRERETGKEAGRERELFYRAVLQKRPIKSASACSVYITRVFCHEREREREKERERETDTLPAARLARFLRATDLRPYCRMKCCLT